MLLGGLALFCQVGLRNRDHQLDAVQLVYLGSTGVVVDRNDVGALVAAAQLLDHGLAHHVVRQARERLSAYDVGSARANKLAHLGG